MAADDTFLERMMLVCMDLVSGYLLCEEVAEERSYATWHTLVKARLATLGVRVFYLYTLLGSRAVGVVAGHRQKLEFFLTLFISR